MQPRARRSYDRDIDIHLDVGPSADEMDIDLVCELTERYGYGGRVAIGHGTKYSLLPPGRLRALGERLASAGVAVTRSTAFPPVRPRRRVAAGSYPLAATRPVP